MEKKSDPGSGMNNEHPKSFIRQLLGLKILAFFDADP
jgi:hypothetical protein